MGETGLAITKCFHVAHVHIRLCCSVHEFRRVHHGGGEQAPDPWVGCKVREHEKINKRPVWLTW